jgi:hypothetical protein
MISKLPASISGGISGFPLFLFLLLYLPEGNLQARKLRVLFVGNSYTYTNNLPQLLSLVATSMGDTLVSDISAPGGYTFKNHFENATTRSKIAAGNWDFVVLQAQSQEPAFSDEQVATGTIPYAQKLDSLIKSVNPCTETAFFLTWGRKDGDASNCPFYPPICTFSGMQDKLSERYLHMAQICGAMLVPVGEVWRKMRTQYPNEELYSSDGSHPALSGSYLTSLVFYQSLFRNVPLPNVYRPTGISAALAENMRMLSVLLVSDSSKKWFGNGKIVQAGISHRSTGISFQVQFKRAGWGIGNMRWNFGDGTESTEEEPVHTFPGFGIYTIRHKISNACYADSVQGQILVQATGVLEDLTHSSPDFFPNPVAGSKKQIHFREKPEEVILLNLQGQRIYGLAESNGVEVPADLPAGMYQLQYQLVGKSRKSSRLLILP